ncbi:MAG: Inner membrane protein YnjF [Chlamydiae bacterium]|nr:Inner membrane protein YnjF [Chlamydiota bacterium]
MIEQYLRPKLEKPLFQPLIKLLVKLNITPNHITLISLILGLSTIPLLMTHHPFTAAIFLWLSGLGDVIDGGLARESEQTSDAGTILDIVSDRCVEFAVIFGLFLVDPTRALITILMLGSVLICVTSFLVVGIVTEKSGLKSFYYSPGLMERLEAFIVFTLMMLFPGYFNLLGWAFIGLVTLTACIRMAQFTKSCT